MNKVCDMKRVAWCCLAMTALGFTVAHAAEPISIESLLREMVDRDEVARYPKADFRLKQDSSYDRSSRTPDEPQGWFSNFDRSTSDQHHNFIRTEENRGRKEWVVMEDEGAGVITRFWVPWRNQLKPGTDIVIRFYLDGASEPAIEGNMFELFQGRGLIPFPLAHESLRSAVSFFPIPYAKSCKVTMSDHPFFFQFTSCAHAHSRWEKVLLHSYYIDIGKLKPFGQMYGHKTHTIALIGVLILIGRQRHILEKFYQGAFGIHDLQFDVEGRAADRSDSVLTVCRTADRYRARFRLAVVFSEPGVWHCGLYPLQ